MQRDYFTTVGSPIGALLLTGTQRALTGIHMDGSAGAGSSHGREDRARFADEIDQIEAYFAGELRDFDISIELSGTPFQTSVWRALNDIAYGRTIPYAELAARAGRPGAARAAGAACGRNPIPIVVPCHRVVGADGSLTGYGGGIGRKRRLLALEAAALERWE
jgi:methylated-DNA-[protein]-cysteine S-methyltransferase